MQSSPDLIYRLLHRDYPESFSVYRPQRADLYDLLISNLPGDWKVERGDMWFYSSPHHFVAPLQGWKIHVSATAANCRQILEKVASVAFTHKKVAFKFAADCSVVALLNSKTWPRGASGKFITIYPADTQCFLQIIEELAQATAGMLGPYILSDHRYKDSRVVFYRYGGIRPHTVLDLNGEKVPVLQNPDGSSVPDQRLAYPSVPAWERPVLPLEGNDEFASSDLCLMDGRYTIETALSFSSAGGVYYARDNSTGDRVVVKEARPFVSATPDGSDAVGLLKKEHRLLTLLADTGVVPRPLALFQEWEHWFLVEEFVDGVVMSHHSAACNILLRTRMTELERDQWCSMFSGLCGELLRILEILHSRNVVFADLSPNNLIVLAGDQKLKIIDFEGAHQPGVDHAVNVFTPGFVSQRRLSGREARPEDDLYSAGAVLFSYLLPINGLLHLNPAARAQFLRSIRNDIGLPQQIIDLIDNLMAEREAAKQLPAPHLEFLPSAPVRPLNAEDHDAGYRNVIDGVVRHLHGVAEYERNDRLYPADPKVFGSNPLSLAYGAAGVTYAIFRMTGAVPQAAMQWMMRKSVSVADYPPGLYVGMSGIAWSLLEMGERKKAEEIFSSTFQHPLLHKSADLFHGMAGWGMTALRFFHATGNEVYLQKATEAGNALLASQTRSGDGCFWTSSGERMLGLAHGSSGVSLFLFYLYLATGEERFLATGVQALDFDLAGAVTTKDGGISFSKTAGSRSPLYPYWRFGSAGIGIVTARYQHLLERPRYHSVLEQIFIDTDRKYSVFPGRLSGLAGIGEFLLDMHHLTAESKFLASANRLAEGIMLFQVEREGTAFPGEITSRLSCDYGTGSAGIALFFNRLLGKQDNDFMLDGLFHPSPWECDPWGRDKDLAMHENMAETV